MLRALLGLMIGMLLGLAGLLALPHLPAIDGRAWPDVLSKVDLRSPDLDRLARRVNLEPVRRFAHEHLGLEIELRSVDLSGLDPRPMMEQTRHALDRALPEPGPRAVKVVLNRDGARLYAGPDHARFGLSSVLARGGIASLEIPAYRGTDRRWSAMKRCVRDRFDRYAVEILSDPPPSGDYMVVHVGGNPDQFGMKKTIQGLAPHTGRLIPNAPVFVFDHAKPNATDLCEVVAHEIGHAIGLDHTRACGDLMSYEDCGKKTFRDRAAACGEWDERDCVDGRATQNSAALLERRVGRRERAPLVS